MTVMANSWNSRPTMPLISSSGMNTAISEMLIEMHGKADLARALDRRLQRCGAGLEMAENILHHDDGVVDHEADGDGQRHQRQIVQAEAGR